MIVNFDFSKRKAPLIVAEISANHNGSLQNVFDLIRLAKLNGADAVKIQTYTPDTITLNSHQEDFMIKEGPWSGRSLYDLYLEAHTPWDWHPAIFAYAKEVGIQLFSSPFDLTAVDFLEELECPVYKVASCEIVDVELVSRIAQTGKPIIISTGMASLDDIALVIETVRRVGSNQIVLLKCVSAYPAPIEECNLLTLVDMQNRFGVPVGLSDHTLDNVAAIVATSLGAVMVEKHFTLSRSGNGPDDKFSMEPRDLKELTSQTKLAFSSIGRAQYEVTDSESANLRFRRSLYFVKDLKKGEVITNRSIKSVRPGFGLHPKFKDDVVGRRVACDVSYGEPVDNKKILFDEG